MCIVQTLKKFRTQTCNATNPLHNVSNSFNSSKLCNENEEQFPWYRPELDTYNQNHMLYYSSESALEEINATDYYFPNTLWIVAEPTEIIVKTSLFIPLALWGIFGNVALLYVIMKYRHLRSPTNMIIANVATVDLVSLMIYPWIFLVCDLFQNYQLGHFGCKVDGWLEFSLMMINVINLSVISYDRLSAIVLPHETRLTREGAKIVIMVSWIISLVVASPLMIYREYKKRQWKDFLEIYCTENTVVISIYWHILLVLAVWIPSALLLICYIAIFIKLDRYEQKVLKREHPLSVCYKTKVAKVLFIVVITFILCRTPFTVLIFRRSQWLKLNLQNQVLDVEHILWFVARYLLYMNAALDPLIYGLTNENFRRAFRTTGFTKIFFPKKKKPQITEKLCVNIIQPRGPYKTEQKSDAWLIRKSQNSFENKSDDSSQTVTKNEVFHS